jgi:uncharacterized protein YjbJ (UPF0337 family)
VSKLLVAATFVGRDVIAYSTRLFAVRNGPGRKETFMKWDEIENGWKHSLVAARRRWTRLTDADWQTVGGKRDQLVARIQERYGVSKPDAEQQTNDWSRALTTTEGAPLVF